MACTTPQNRNRFKPLLLGALLLLFGVQFFFGQESGESQRPKVGLVLSGGGAKGLAHIGALKVIEEAGIELDYIGGTSMGAIVGALYASGYSAQELDSIFYAFDFTELIQDKVPRGAKTFYEKDDDERYALGLPFDGFKVSFPQAFSGGQNIYNELVRLLYHVKDVQDFNNLPIPFLCIATDVESGEGILLDHGYLPEAITASGTFPSLFEPMEIDGRVLIDGGVVNNFPIDEIRALGADIIIGVDVQHGLSSREDLGSATEILLQINNYRTVRDMEKKRKKVDLYIHPEMEEYSVIDFELGAEIIAKGEKQARTQWKELKALGEQLQNPRSFNALVQKNKSRAQKAGENREYDTIVINRLRIFGTENYSRSYIKGKLRFDLAEPITFTQLKQGLNNLAASGNFKGIRYVLRSNGLGTDLILKLKEDPTKMLLKMGAHYDDLFKSSALINLTRKNFIAKDDVASFDLILGDNIRYSLQYYQDKGPYWSFGFNSSLNDFERSIDFDIIQSNFNVIQDPNIGEINLDVTEWKNQLYLQTVLREEFAFRLGVEHKLLKYSTRTLRTIEDVLPDQMEDPTGGNSRTFFENSNFYSTYGSLVLDTYDDRYFPTKGLYFNGDFHLYLFSSDFNDNFKEFSVAQAQIGASFPLTDKLSWQLETEGGFKLGLSRVTSFDFVLGGFGNEPVNNFRPFIGYDFLSLPGNSYVKAYTRFDYRFAPKNHLLLVANVANVEDDLFRTGNWLTAPDFRGYGLGWGYESFLGPVQILGSWSPETTQSHVYFSVGFWF